jgi:hypothetical protein
MHCDYLHCVRLSPLAAKVRTLNAALARNKKKLGCVSHSKQTSMHAPQVFLHTQLTEFAKRMRLINLKGVPTKPAELVAWEKQKGGMPTHPSPTKASALPPSSPAPQPRPALHFGAAPQPEATPPAFGGPQPKAKPSLSAFGSQTL